MGKVAASHQRKKSQKRSKIIVLYIFITKREMIAQTNIFMLGGGEGVLPYFSYSYIQLGICHLIGYGFQGALSLNRVSFLALWSFDRVPKSQTLLKNLN